MGDGFGFGWPPLPYNVYNYPPSLYNVYNFPPSLYNGYNAPPSLYSGYNYASPPTPALFGDFADAISDAFDNLLSSCPAACDPSWLGDGVCNVRTSSRLGYLDYGVNAKRFNWFAQRLGGAKGWKTAPLLSKGHEEYFALNNVGDRDMIK